MHELSLCEAIAATVTKHRDGILAAVRLGATNARAEALNNKVRLIVRRAMTGRDSDAKQISMYSH